MSPPGFYSGKGDHWPKLSESLAGPKAPNRCQSCGCDGSESTLEKWHECDQFDRPTAVRVILCPACSKRIIEPHPRLFIEVPHFKPLAGACDICVGCRHRDGATCKSPGAAFNGGPGIHLIGPKPTRMHVLRRPARGSGWMEIYDGPARDCTGREEVDPS
jgi:hypothetical protein